MEGSITKTLIIKNLKNKATKNEECKWLTGKQISEALQKIVKTFQLENKNAETYNYQENAFSHCLSQTNSSFAKKIHIVNAGDHWVTVTNVHPDFPNEEHWIMYDSLNDEEYLHRIKSFLKIDKNKKK